MTDAPLEGLTKQEYRHALQEIGLTPFSKAAARMLGVKPRTARYYAARGIPDDCPAARLVRLILRLRLVYNDALEGMMTREKNPTRNPANGFNEVRM